jgi:hypothetical protein
MSFKPEDYPGEYPDEWYDTHTGQIVGHVSLLRDMISPDTDAWPAEIIENAKKDSPRIVFSIGSWIDDTWVNGISGGYGVVLGLNEDSEIPTVLLGDFREFDQNLDGSDESAVVVRHDLHELPLDKIGMIQGAVAPPEIWNDVE